MAHRRRKPEDFALLLEEEPASEMPLEEDEDDLGDDFEDDMAEDMPEEDPLAAESDMMGPGIDPEQAALAETLGFTEPDQQQALVDLIKLVTAQDPMSTDSGSALPPLPESTY